MHAASLGNPNPNGNLWLPRLFTRVAPSCAIHTTHMEPCDLGFPLPLGVLLITGVFPGTHLSWPNLVICTTNARCHIDLTLFPRTHRHILVIDIRQLISTLTHAAYETLAHAACGTQLTWPIITSGHQCPRTDWYTYHYLISNHN